MVRSNWAVKAKVKLGSTGSVNQLFALPSPLSPTSLSPPCFHSVYRQTSRSYVGGHLYVGKHKEAGAEDCTSLYRTSRATRRTLG